MDQSLYSHSLLIALPLMLFFGLHMLLGRTPEKKIYSSYLLSRRLMGVALLILTANYSVHLFYGIRMKDVNATILMNLSTYFICYWLFSAAMMTLLDKTYITMRRFLVHTALWAGFSALSVVVSLAPDNANARPWCIAALAAWLVIYGMTLSVRLLRTYYRAIRMFGNTHSDDIGSYIRWLSVFTYWAIGFGVSCGLLTFLPDKYVFIWILSAIPFYVYLYCQYQNYILFYEKVENAIREDFPMGGIVVDGQDDLTDADALPACHLEIADHIRHWTDAEGYRLTGITLNELSVEFATNRTYLSQYINAVYHVNFRDWITDMRIDYAKRLMRRQPHLKLQEISEMSGFSSLSQFTRTFTAREGCLPSKWRSKRT